MSLRVGNQRICGQYASSTRVHQAPERGATLVPNYLAALLIRLGGE